VPQGRPVSPRGIYSLADRELAPPSAVVLDSSVVIEALISSQPDHDACQAFLLALAEADTLIVFNELLELELQNKAFELALQEQFGKQWRPARYDGRARRRASRRLDEVLEAWNEVLGVVRHAVYSIEEVSDEVPRLMARWGLSSYDAVHAATALSADIGTLATLDTGFSNIPASVLTLYMRPSKVRFCRQVRARPRVR
jgi:predicted nucleic acid-binding protein